MCTSIIKQVCDLLVSTSFGRKCEGLILADCFRFVTSLEDGTIILHAVTFEPCRKCWGGGRTKMVVVLPLTTVQLTLVKYPAFSPSFLVCGGGTGREVPVPDTQARNALIPRWGFFTLRLAGDTSAIMSLRSDISPFGICAADNNTRDMLTWTPVTHQVPPHKGLLIILNPRNSVISIFLLCGRVDE